MNPTVYDRQTKLRPKPFQLNNDVNFVLTKDNIKVKKKSDLSAKRLDSAKGIVFGVIISIPIWAIIISAIFWLI
jgi:hypothetical protein